jgi:hypothetical protein
LSGKIERPWTLAEFKRVVSQMLRAVLVCALVAVVGVSAAVTPDPTTGVFGYYAVRAKTGPAHAVSHSDLACVLFSRTRPATPVRTVLLFTRFSDPVLPSPVILTFSGFVWTAVIFVATKLAARPFCFAHHSCLSASLYVHHAVRQR